MYDLHTHTVFSDGCLVPSEQTRRYVDKGYKGLVLSDHVDSSNIEHVVSSLVRFSNEDNPFWKDIDVLPGCELTHILPERISDMTGRARDLGARIVIVHGETIVEPVAAGTNRAAIEAGVDILAHPGLITDEDALLAAQKGVFLEITSRAGHSYSNGHVANMARKHGAKLVYSSDCHGPQNILSAGMVMRVLHGAGLDHEELKTTLNNTQELFKSKL